MGAVPTQGLGVVGHGAPTRPLSSAEDRIAKAAARSGCDASGDVNNRRRWRA